MATMDISHTVSEIDGDFSRKIAKISHPLVFYVPAEGFPLELGIGDGGQKTRMMGLLGRKEVLQYLKPSGYNPPT